jgi:hypothetical protein
VGGSSPRRRSPHARAYNPGATPQPRRGTARVGAVTCLRQAEGNQPRLGNSGTHFPPVWRPIEDVWAATNYGEKPPSPPGPLVPETRRDRNRAFHVKRRSRKRPTRRNLRTVSRSLPAPWSAYRRPSISLRWGPHVAAVLGPRLLERTDDLTTIVDVVGV